MKLLFLPDNIEIELNEKITILEAIQRAGINIFSACGGNGYCGKCRVKVLNNADPPGEIENRFLSEKEISKNWRLACRNQITDGLKVEIPLQNRIGLGKKPSEKIFNKILLNPNIKKIYLDLSNEKVIHSDISLLNEKVKGIIQKPDVDFAVLKDIHSFINNSEPTFTCVFVGNRLVSLEKGNTSNMLYGIALDIGTTTVVCLLINLNTGKTIDALFKVNSQISYGFDIVERLNYVINNESGLETLHKGIVNTVNEIIKELLSRNNIDKNSVYEICAAGNTAMSHFFLGVSPEGLATAPYLPTFTDSVNINAEKINVEINSKANIYIFPQIGGFIGGDTVGLILNSSIELSEKIILGIDLGTNGEIVLGSKNRIIACSTAAGPAFEGVGINCGMPAIDGAIESVLFENGEVKLKIIGDGKPAGICGSGLIDITAELLSCGILDSKGRLKNIDELNSSVNQSFKSRILRNKDANIFRLYIDSNMEIFISQEDIRKIQLAKAAIESGIKILKNEWNITNEDIAEVLIAGAFGNYIRKSSIRTIGLLSDFPEEKIKFIGNSASAGAKLALISLEERRKAEKIAKAVRHINLASRNEFVDEFISSSIFPDNKNYKDE